MAKSFEYMTIVGCTDKLEIALRSAEAGFVHFLHNEGFITQEIHDDVLDPRCMLNSHQKAVKLVTAIRNSVELSAKSYDILVNYLRLHQKMRTYKIMLDILDEKYNLGMLLAN